MPDIASALRVPSDRTAVVVNRQQTAIGSYIAQAQDQATAILTVNEVFRATEPKAFPDDVVAEALQRLCGAAAALPEPSALPAGSRMPLVRNPLFVGRGPDLSLLAGHLTGETVNPVAVLAVTGVGGMGKTQLAVEFAHRFGQYFPGGVHWLSFANAAGVPNEVAALAPGLLTIGSDFAEMRIDFVVRLVKQAWHSPMPRLLIFDNCEDEQLLQTWRPSSGGCRVLVTSRRPTWDASLGVKCVHLREFQEEESGALLRCHRDDLPVEHAALKEIAAELGHLPLALHLAGSFLSRYRHTPAGDPDAYLGQLKSPNLFQHRSFDSQSISPTGHDHNLARTFELSRAQLNNQSELDRTALRLLDRICFFAAGDVVPRALVLATIMDDTDEIAAEDALMRLSDLGLVDIEVDGNVRAHRLVAAYARNMVTDNQALRAVEATLLMAFRELQRGYRIATARSLEPHLLNVVSRAQKRTDALAALLCNIAGNHFRQDYRFSIALPYLERGLAIQEKHLPDDAHGLGLATNDLGLILALLGETDRPKELYERALRIWRKRENWPNLAATLDNLGQLFSNRGLVHKAREAYGEALEIRERVLGPNDPAVSITLHNLAELLVSDGDYAGATEYHRRALAIREKTLEPDHPSTATSFSNLGIALLHQGDVAEARKNLEKALRIRERALGAQDPRTRNSRQAMAALLMADGEQSAAADLLKDSLAAGQELQVLQQAATTCNNIGLGLFNRGNYSRARRMYELASEYDRMATALRSESSGLDRTSVVLMNNLGKLLEAQGDNVEARAIYERTFDLHTKSGDISSPLAGRIFNNFGAFLRSQGEPGKARPLLEKAFKIRKQTLGARHRDTAITLCNLGMLASDEGDTKSGSRLIGRAISILRALGPNVDLARSLHQLGLVRISRGEPKAAIAALSEALQIRQQLYPDGHPENAATAQALGRLARDSGDASTAREYLTLALDIAQKRLGETHGTTVSTRHDLERLSTNAGG